MPDKGSALNERVWKLFERAGFYTRPNSNDPTEEVVELTPKKVRTLDLLATDTTLGVKIIGWNKARKDFTESFSVHLHDYETLMKLTDARTVLFVCTEKDLSPEDKDYARQKRFTVWGKEELDYYEALVDAIGDCAKYEIIHSLGLTTTEESHMYNVLAIKLRQPFPDSSIDLFLFTVPPQILLKTCAVLRKAQGNKDAYQRILQKKRLAKIARFVTQKEALLPPNIIVHLGSNVRWERLEIPNKDASGRGVTLARKADYELVLLSIPMQYASLELIDGQHRLYGFVTTNPATKDHFNLVVVGLANLTTETKTNTFVAINDNARRVDPNLVAYLKLTHDEPACQENNELMAIKVVFELNRTSPLKKRIRLLDTGNEKITLKGFAGYDLKGLLGKRGLLRKYYPTNSSDAYTQALRIYFGVLKNLFPEQWNEPERYVIFTNRGVSAFLKLLKSILKTEQRPLTNAIVKKYLQPLKDEWEDAHWETASLSNSYVGSKGWKDFHRDLMNVIRKKYPSFQE